jgi:hypothetical protein
MVVDTPDMIGIFIPVTFNAAVLKDNAMVSQPIWAELPSVQDFQAGFPKNETGVNNVRGVLGCLVEASGTLSSCWVAQEDPADQGYGAGALALTSKFKVAPWGLDGAGTTGAHIKLPIRYALTSAAA